MSSDNGKSDHGLWLMMMALDHDQDLQLQAIANLFVALKAFSSQE